MEKSKSGDKPSGQYDTFDSLGGITNQNQDSKFKGYPGAPGPKEGPADDADTNGE